MNSVAIARKVKYYAVRIKKKQGQENGNNRFFYLSLFLFTHLFFSILSLSLSFYLSLSLSLSLSVSLTLCLSLFIYLIYLYSLKNLLQLRFSSCQFYFIVTCVKRTQRKFEEQMKKAAAAAKENYAKRQVISPCPKFLRSFLPLGQVMAVKEVISFLLFQFTENIFSRIHSKLINIQWI